ncbi:Uncharacterised protein [Streptococcus pneumoniae]|nr:Uncharacterised protein [Streptococcus pneumoniae]
MLSAMSTVFTWATRTLFPLSSKVLASMSINSSADLLAKLVPAFNIAKPYSSKFTPANSTNSGAMILSVGCVVGDFKRRVSEIKPESIKPAISLGTATPCSLNIR